MASLLNMSGGSLLDSISYVSWLKSLGCICWLPLSEEGDLLDRISGKGLELTGNGSFVWDSSVSMYKMTTPGIVNQYTAWLDNGVDENSFPNDEFTTFTSFRKITHTGFGISTQISPISTDSNTQQSLNPLYNGSGQVSNLPNGLNKLSYSYKSDYRFFCQNGNFVTYSAAPTYAPSYWKTSAKGITIGMVRRNDIGYKNQNYYIKDIYLFNKALALEQMRQIQGYDPLPSNVRR